MHKLLKLPYVLAKTTWEYLQTDEATAQPKQLEHSLVIAESKDPVKFGVENATAELVTNEYTLSQLKRDFRQGNSYYRIVVDYVDVTRFPDMKVDLGVILTKVNETLNEIFLKEEAIVQPDTFGDPTKEIETHVEADWLTRTSPTAMVAVEISLVPVV